MPEAIVNAYRSGDRLVVLRRDERGRLVERRERAEYSLFLSRADFAKVEQDARAQQHKGRLALSDEGAYVRLRFRDEELRYRLWTEGYFERAGAAPLEADVHPVSRFLVDSGCDLQRPVAGYLDLETDSRVPFGKLEQARILCWSLTLEDGTQYGGVLEDDTDAAERELLLDLLHELGLLDQVRCWNGAKFDEKVLRARARRAGLSVAWGRWLWLDHMLCFEKYNKHSAAGAEKQSMALARVAESLGLDVGAKTAVDASKSWELWATGGAARKSLYRRNAVDSRLMLEIEKKKPYCDLHYGVCRTSGCLPDTRSLKASVHVEAFLMRLGAERGLRFPSKRQFGDDYTPEQFEGAFVFEPTPGLYRGVHVCDFSGMYPTIIESLNISPETHAPEHSGQRGETFEQVRARLPPGHSLAPRTLQAFRTDVEGLLAVAVRVLKAMRKKYAAIMKQFAVGSREWAEADALSQGAKIAVNSCFGVVGSVYSRFFKRECAESITTTGAWLIEHVIEFGRDRWTLRPIAGDTDSLFAVGLLEPAFRAFVAQCNAELFPRLMADLCAVKNELSLDYEKEFDVLILCAKKRYASRYAHYKGRPPEPGAPPNIRGLEYQRGDATELARKFQEQAIRKLLMLDAVVEKVPDPYPLRPEDFHELVLGWKARVLEGELTLRDVMLSQSLKGAPESYKVALKQDGTPAAQPIHVRVAQVLAERGEDMSEGSRVEYVIVDGDATPQRAIPASDWKPGMEDRAHAWEKEIWPATRRVLAACWPAHNWGRFDEGKDRGGGRGRSHYLPGQSHFGFWDS